MLTALIKQEGKPVPNILFRSIAFTVSSFTDFVHWCGNSRDLSSGKLAHDSILQTGLDGDTYLSGILVQMYAKCDALDDALTMFDFMSYKHAHLWNSIIGALARNDNSKDAIRLFEEMQQQGILPEQGTYICVISACGSSAFLNNGILIHAQISTSDGFSDISICNAVLHMYGKCGHMEKACDAFMDMPCHDVVSWTAIIRAYAQLDKGWKAFKFFQNMLQEGISPNKVTYISLLSAMTSSEYLSWGTEMHARVAKAEFGCDVNLGNAVINMYGKCGNFERAYVAFSDMEKRDIVSYNAVISACAMHGKIEEVFQIFLQMSTFRLKPNKTTLVSILSACTSKCDGMLIHYLIVEFGFEVDVFIGTTLVSMYGKCHSVEDAEYSFNCMSERTIITGNALIKSCVQCGQCVKALQLSALMLQHGLLPNKVTTLSLLELCAEEGWLDRAKGIHVCILCTDINLDLAVGNALINTYAKCSCIDVAKREFSKLHVRDVVSWTSMITMYVQDGQYSEAFTTFEKMQREGFGPDEVTYTSILYGCAKQSKLTEGEEIYASLIAKGINIGIRLLTVLITMYGKCGDLLAACQIFERLKRRNVVVWTAMIAAHAYHGQGNVALRLYEQMRLEFVPDKVTFLSILAACSHSGLIDEGNYFLHCMKNEHNLSPAADHYGCIVDLLGRAGHLDEAEALIEEMPEDPSLASYTSLLGACRNRDDKERAERTVTRVFETDIVSASPCVVYSNILVSSAMEPAEVVNSEKRYEG